jgi:hypothetical protein
MPITALPPAPLPTDTQAQFNTKAFNLVASLATFVTEANAVETAVDADAATASAAAATATNAAATAQAAGTGITGSSSTSLVIGTGSKSLTIETGRTFVAGIPVRIGEAGANANTNFMDGDVTSYVAGTGALVVNVTATGGSGTLSSWSVRANTVRLPVQTGNGGRFLRTDGSALSWTAVAGLDGATLTAGATLTNASAAGIRIATPTAGHYLTLPNATTCTKAAVLFSISNAGDFDVGIRNSAGTQLGWVRARSHAVIGLADNSTSAGQWSSFGLERLGITAVLSNMTLASVGAGSNFSEAQFTQVVIDSNRTMLLFGYNTIYAIIYDSSTQTWGTPATVRTGATVIQLSAILSAANQVLAVWSNNTNQLVDAIVLSVSGTTITVNTMSSSTGTRNYVPPNDLSGYLVAVGSSWVYAYKFNSPTSATAIRAITISGTTVTIGAETEVQATDSTSIFMTANGSVLRTVSISGASALHAKPYTISGTTITPGTSTSVTSSVSGFAWSATVNGNGNIVVAHVSGGGVPATIFRLTGTTEAASTATVLSSVTSSKSELLPISAGKTAVAYMGNSSNNFVVNIITDTAGTASVGTAVNWALRTTQGIIQAIGVSGNVARFAIAQSSGLTPTQIAVDCSGTSPTLLSMVSDMGGVSGGAQIAGSDFGGRRAFGTLIAGTSLYRLGNLYDLMVVPGLIARLPPSTLGRTSPGFVVNGAATNECWTVNKPADTSGIQIYRTEAAA